MPGYERHIFVCTNQRPPGSPRGSCDPAGEGALQKLFKAALRRYKLVGRVRANSAGCLDQCEHGPVVVVYPEAVWYGNVRPEDVDEIVDSHVVGGVPVERLRMKDGCVATTSCEHRPAKAPVRAPSPEASGT